VARLKAERIERRRVGLGVVEDHLRHAVERKPQVAALPLEALLRGSRTFTCADERRARQRRQLYRDPRKYVLPRAASCN